MLINTHPRLADIDKCLHGVSQILMQRKLLKCTESIAWLCNGLRGSHTHVEDRVYVREWV